MKDPYLSLMIEGFVREGGVQAMAEVNEEAADLLSELVMLGQYVSALF